jgi:hypothetical protein
VDGENECKALANSGAHRWTHRHTRDVIGVQAALGQQLLNRLAASCLIAATRTSKLAA